VLAQVKGRDREQVVSTAVGSSSQRSGTVLLVDERLAVSPVRIETSTTMQTLELTVCMAQGDLSIYQSWYYHRGMCIFRWLHQAKPVAQFKILLFSLMYVTSHDHLFLRVIDWQRIA